MAKPKIFVSYDYDNDWQHKKQLVAWDARQEFEFGCAERAAAVAFESADAAFLKRAIAVKIARATVFLCLVGRHTHKCPWVAWEIERAVELERKVIALKIEAGNITPTGLLNIGADWALSFSFDALREAVGRV